MSTEYNHVIDEAFQRGLPPKDKLGNNLPFLETANNLKVTERGGNAHSTVTMPFALPSAVAGPHPRYHHGEKQKLLAYEAALYTVNPATWATAAETIYNPASVDASVTPDLGTDAETDWHIADFGDVWFAANVHNLLFRVGHLKRSGNDPVWRVYCGKDAVPSTVTQNRGTLFMGGFTDAGRFATTRWDAVWAVWKEATRDDIVVHEAYNVGKNFVMYSSPGGGGIDWPFAVELAILGYPDNTSFDNYAGHLKELVHEGVIGFIPIPDDDVKLLKPLGRATMVYGERTVGVIIPADPASGARFVYHRLLEIGVKGRSAVAGDDSSHVMLDSQGAFWRFTGEGAPERLDYRAHTSVLSVSTVGAYDPEEGDYWFVDSDTCMVLTPTGASFNKTRAWSLFCHPSLGLVGVKDASADNGAFEIVTTPYDMKRRTVKATTVIELGFENITSLSVTNMFRYPQDTSWRSAPAQSIVDHPVVYQRISATDFKLKITGTLATGARLNFASIRWQDSGGKQHVRGLRNE